MKAAFTRFAQVASAALGSAWTFMALLVFCAGWCVLTLLGRLNDSAQLGFTLVLSITAQLTTMLVLNTQQRDGKAVQLKLDALIDASAAQNTLIDIEHLSDDALAGIEQEMQRRRAGLAQ